MRDAFIVQDEIVAALGGGGVWKVGAANGSVEPGVSRLPRSLLHSGSTPVKAGDFAFIGIEGEIGFTLGRDLPARPTPYTRSEVLAAVASVHPMIELVDSRYSRWRERSPLEQTADLANHGALVIGPASAAAASIDQSVTAAEIWVDGERRVSLVGGNTAVDVQRLLTWLANHAIERGHPLCAGDIVTSGSCTGLIEVSVGCVVEARIGGVGIARVTLTA